MRRPLAYLLSGLFAFAVLAAGSLTTTPSVFALTTIAPTTYCGNSILNPGGMGLICEVTVVNTITPPGGFATVTVRECQGAADAENACTITTQILTTPVTGVNQCNGSTNGGGGTLRCSVDVTNNFYGLSPTETAATVNQCNGSGAGPSGDITTGCTPFPADTTNATITQCNGSANGLTLVELTCTATGTKPSVRAVRVNQCNGSGNGGGSLVICSTNIENNSVAGSPPPTPTAAPTATPAPGATARPTPPNTSTGQLTAQPSGTDVLIVPGLMLLFALSLLTVIRRRQTR
jgi:hypothetical protein